ncbi:aminoglycoside phosphotransferase family protein [Nocardia suismassiliense]|uniref:aminoglycoside phosphotransferase family protein n=1 Tax=Nocardia suismassiliense TaxID=2077092 RepID=UPI000D1FB03E|nr:aminoglycoside phosphotransferase family protein [Nocardia suismassiliense]
MSTPTGTSHALHTACRQVDLDSRDAQLLHERSNTVYLLPHANVIARISHNEHHGLQARASVAITKWLAEQNIPVTEPVIDHAVDIDHDTVTFWQYYPQHGRGEPPSHELATILRQLHALPGPFPFELPTYLPLAGLTQALADPHASSALDSGDRQWLTDQACELVDSYHNLDSHLGRGLVHGDAYSGNTLWGPDRVLLGDWDEISIAPRELDLIHTFQSTRFGLTDTELTDFSTAYGWDIRDWNGYTTLLAMRDLHTLISYIRRASNHDQLAQHELDRRIRSLRNPNFADTQWRAIS